MKLVAIVITCVSDNKFYIDSIHPTIFCALDYWNKIKNNLEDAAFCYKQRTETKDNNNTIPTCFRFDIKCKDSKEIKKMKVNFLDVDYFSNQSLEIE